MLVVRAFHQERYATSVDTICKYLSVVVLSELASRVTRTPRGGCHENSAVLKVKSHCSSQVVEALFRPLGGRSAVVRDLAVRILRHLEII